MEQIIGVRKGVIGARKGVGEERTPLMFEWFNNKYWDTKSYRLTKR